MDNTTRPVYVVDGSRTPFLKACGRPGPFDAVDLAVAAGRPLLLRQPFAPDVFDEVILGCGAPPAHAPNPARVAALRLGCGDAMPGRTVQRNCGSGMQSVDTAWRYIADGRADLILAGGTEALSHAPLLVNDAMVNWLSDWNKASARGRLRLLTRLRARHFKPVIGLAKGLSDPVVELSMGQTAEVLAHQFHIDREAMDGYALASHLRLAQAQEGGRLDDEIEVIYDRNGRRYERDDGVRPDTSMEKLVELKPVFEPPYGDVTAGNSSQVTDGATWVILASEAAIERHHLKPLGRILDCLWAALDPAHMGLAPVMAVTPLLTRHGLSLTDIEYWEINEAFAAQVLACLSAWNDPKYCEEYLGLNSALGEIESTRLNVDGGAISLGHPVGASGTRIILHLFHVLKRNEAKRGIATECIGGGQGGAMLLERA